MIILSHPTGNENVRQAAVAFAKANLLEKLFTTINWNPASAFDRILPSGIRESFRRRSFPEMVRCRTRSLPVREAARLFFGAIHLPLWSEHERGFLSIDAVSAALDRVVAAEIRRNENCNLAYAYEGCAITTFEAAQHRQIPRIYDLPIGYWRVAQRI